MGLYLRAALIHGWSWAVLTLPLISCGKAKDAPLPVFPPSEVEKAYQAASGRLLSGFLEGSWVVTRSSDGTPRDRGDSLLWTGVALSALSCADGTEIEHGLIEAFKKSGGALYRYPEIQGDVSLDGALGFYRGVTHRSLSCLGSAVPWKEVIALHAAYIDTHYGRLNQKASATLGAFRYVLDLLRSSLGLKEAPRLQDQRGIELEVATWAAAVNATHSAAYRIHLGFLALSTIEELGRPVSQEGRNAFCAASAGADMPTVDHWCGRADLKAWAKAFKENEWMYRHQRAGAWEGPDGSGHRTPGLDLIVGLKQAYQL